VQFHTLPEREACEVRSGRGGRRWWDNIPVWTPGDQIPAGGVGASVQSSSYPVPDGERGEARLGVLRHNGLQQKMQAMS